MGLDSPCVIQTYLLHVHVMIQYIIAVPPDALAHLREVDADGVGFVLPGYVDL